MKVSLGVMVATFRKFGQVGPVGKNEFRFDRGLDRALSLSRGVGCVLPAQGGDDLR